MRTYEIRAIDISKAMSVDDYEAAYNSAVPHICVGLRQTEGFCECKLRRERCGWYGVNGNIEYIAVAIA